MAFAELPVEDSDCTTIIRSGGGGGGGVRPQQTTAGTIRQRLRRSRTRTGCLTCRLTRLLCSSRHLKCDENKPLALRPSILQISSKDKIEQDEAAGASLAEDAVVYVRQYTEPEPPRWQEMEALRYYREFILPLKEGEVMDRFGVLPPWNGPHGYMLLLDVATHRILVACRTPGMLITAKDDPSIRGAWAAFSRQVAKLLASVNKDLSDATKSTYEKLETFQKIFHLTFYDLAVNPSALRQHSSGYRALMEHVGGARVLMRETDLQFNFTQFSMLIIVISNNTTCPANKLVRGFEEYTDEDLTKLVNVLGERNFHVPLPLFIAGNRLTELRRQVADGTCSSAGLTAAARDHFDAIGAFDADKWARSTRFEVDSPASAFARIFQVAVRLYGILSLPPSVVVSWALARSYPRLPRLSVYDSVLVSHRRKLLKKLYRYRGTFSNKRDMTWPLVVVGASLTGDGQDEDRNFVAESLLDIWRNPLARCSPVLCLEKLHIFWASGKKAWDDCFYEMTPCVA
ncbi:hypothetical protein NLG97_g8659 [Lecanicillium saksenae]|uniref:Uncharacterized protein n=1 Tax=Lecanicillium saksenae TaxID=468837 RepID=A0ACC1QM52_9HYPO|nr:hypothetical protein NLG97_g8659 [Lecanicillium saksenae]